MLGSHRQQTGATVYTVEVARRRECPTCQPLHKTQRYAFMVPSSSVRRATAAAFRFEGYLILPWHPRIRPDDCAPGYS